MAEAELKDAAAQHQVIGADALASTGGHTEHPDAQWFGEAGLGMFLHWGISSVSGEFDISWAMKRNFFPPRKTQSDAMGLGAPGLSLPPAEYWAYAKKFQPKHFDPEKILFAARDAGFRYAVLTTKHHDGFALWPSAYGNFNTKNDLGGRDLVGEFVDACRKAGLKVGLYYSPPDWYFARRYTSFGCGAFLDDKWREVPPCTPTAAELDDLRAYIKGQVEELLTRYGKIDLLWFDGAAPEGTPLSLESIRALQPGIVVNNRIGFGDYRTPEGTFPASRPEGWWEECHCLNIGGWAYRIHELYQPAGFLPMELAKVRSWNGNFLLNFAPNGDGELPEVAYRRLAEIGAWMRDCGEAYFGTEGGDWPESCSRPVTRHGNRTYVHFDYLCDGKAEYRALPSRPRRVFDLKSKRPVEYRWDGGTLTIALDPERLPLMGAITVLEW